VYCAGVVQIVTRSNRTPYRPRPRLTGAKGSVWIWPLSATEHTHRPVAGGSRSNARNALGSALFCPWMRPVGSVHAGWCAGHATPSSRYAIDHSRIVSGGRPVIDHEHATHSHGDERASAWS